MPDYSAQGPSAVAPMRIGTVVYKGKEYDIKSVKYAGGSSGDNTVLAAVTGSQIVVIGFQLANKGTIIDAKFTDGAGGTDLTGPVTLPAAAAARWDLPVHFNMPLTPCTVSTALILNLSGAQVVNGVVFYILI